MKIRHGNITTHGGRKGRRSGDKNERGVTGFIYRRRKKKTALNKGLRGAKGEKARKNQGGRANRGQERRGHGN